MNDLEQIIKHRIDYYQDSIDTDQAKIDKSSPIESILVTRIARHMNIIQELKFILQSCDSLPVADSTVFSLIGSH